MIPFTKMQGIGNDFVVVDSLLHGSLSELDRLASKVCDRRRGVGADGLIVIEPSTKAPFRMRYLNSDGSESEMCGNGIRCFARLLREHGHVTESTVSVETGAGVLEVEYLADGRMRVDLGPATLEPESIGMSSGGKVPFLAQTVPGGFAGTAVSMGNPHLVIFADEVADIDLAHWGPLLEKWEAFPQRVNVHFVEVKSRSLLHQRTWERGAGPTLACGTGAASVAVAGYLEGRTDRNVSIVLPGGTLELEYLENGHVLMTGPAEIVFTGTY